LLVTITYAGPEATDLGYLLHKHPGKVQTFETTVGQAHVFYTETDENRCTAAMLMEVDAIALARNRHLRGGGDASSLDDYVNDRPYAASSLTAVALGQLFGTAMTGRCDARPELAASTIDLEISLTAVPVRGEAGLATRLFGPLGFEVAEQPIPLDAHHPHWGNSNYVNILLTGKLQLSAALRQIYVLLPVMDDSKHYWVGSDEIGKLLRAGNGWLPDHPERKLITERYLAHQRGMVNEATLLIAPEVGADQQDDGEAADGPLPLYRRRAEAVMQALRDVGARRVADVGCGEGALLKSLMIDSSFTQIIGTDVSANALARAEARLNLNELSPPQRARVRLLHSSATYIDDRLQGLDAVVLMEVIEHVEPERLTAVVDSVFKHAGPRTVVVTTPNVEYNPLYPGLSGGGSRHPDHRFEWTRAEFRSWAAAICVAHAYAVEFRDVGDSDPLAGPPTQLALFRKG
jgi:3' terminal RNA ribose 2'-O-methyltransferase Hen1